MTINQNPTLWLGGHQVELTDNDCVTLGDGGFVRVRRVDGGHLNYDSNGHNKYTEVVHTNYLTIKVGA